MAYIAGALLLVFVAVGVGATAGVVVSRWQPVRVASGSGGPAESRTLEATVLETTSSAETFEGTAIETTTNTKNAKPHQPADVASFVHRATDENSRGDYTYISDPSIDGDANAVVLVTPTPSGGGAGAASYDHNIGVWYDFVNKKKWAIFNQDRAPVPAGATFKVVVPPASERFIHHAELDNTARNTTYLDEPLTNGHPDAVLSVTQNWNPGGGRGVYNDHPIGVRYDEDVAKWAIYNRDGAPIPDGAAFNVAVSGGTEPAK